MINCNFSYTCVFSDAWVMLRYECNKCPNSSEGQCIGHRSTSIFIVCDPHAHNEYVST